MKKRFKPFHLINLSGMAGAMLFLVVLVVLDILQARISGVVLTVSDMVHGSLGWLQNTSFVLFSLLFFIFVIRLFWFNKRRFSSFVGTALFGLTSLSMILITAVPNQSGVLMLHNAIAGLICASFMTGCIAFAVHFWRRAGWKKYAAYTLGTLVSGLVFAMLWALLPARWNLTGVSEQMVFVNGIVWVSVISVKLFREHVWQPQPQLAPVPISRERPE